MKFVLVSGGLHQMVVECLNKKIDIVNKKELKLNDLNDFLQEVNPDFGGVLITDEAFSQTAEQDKKDMSLFFQWLEKENKTDVRVLVITRDFMKETDLSDLLKRYENLSIRVSDFIRVPFYFYNTAIEELVSKKRQTNGHSYKNEKPIEVEKKR